MAIERESRGAHEPCCLLEMLASQVIKRFFPSGLLQAQAACGSRLGLDATSQAYGNERFHSDGEMTLDSKSLEAWR